MCTQTHRSAEAFLPIEFGARRSEQFVVESSIAIFRGALALDRLLWILDEGVCSHRAGKTDTEFNIITPHK